MASGNDSKIKLYNLNNNYECILTIEAHTQAILTMLTMNNGYLASGGKNKEVKIWNWDQNSNQLNNISTLTGHEEDIEAIQQFPDGKLITMCRQKIIVWDNNFTKVKEIMNNQDNGTNLYNASICLLSNDIIVALTNSLDLIKIFNLDNDNAINGLPSLSNATPFRNIFYTSNGLIASMTNSMLHILDTKNSLKKNIPNEQFQSSQMLEI